MNEAIFLLKPSPTCRVNCKCVFFFFLAVCITVLKVSNFHTSVSYRKQCVVSSELIILFFFNLIHVIDKNIKLSSCAIKCFHSLEFIITIFECKHLILLISL